MNPNFILLFFIILSELLVAQPFRYKQGNEHDRDSIKLLKIKSYSEFIAYNADTSAKQLITINEYDTNGNLIRELKNELKTGVTYQWKFNFSPENNLLEKSSFYPDTLTPTDQQFFAYDSTRNLLDKVNIVFTKGKRSSYSKISNCYNDLNQLVEIKQYDSVGKVVVHREYIFDAFGRQTEELVYDNFGRLQWRRPSSNSLEREQEMYGLPHEPNPEMETLLKETITYNSWTGEKTVSDGYGFRIFSKEGILLKWVENNYRYHWFEYTFHEARH